jgi:hypothetical protein
MLKTGMLWQINFSLSLSLKLIEGSDPSPVIVE